MRHEFVEDTEIIDLANFPSNFSSIQPKNGKRKRSRTVDFTQPIPLQFNLTQDRQFFVEVQRYNDTGEFATTVAIAQFSLNEVMHA